MSKRSFMFTFIFICLVVIVILAKGYIDKICTAKSLNETFVTIDALTAKIEENRRVGITLKASKIDLQEYKPAAVEDIRISPSGIIQLKFQNSIKELGGRWIFIIPAIRTAGESFSYLDTSKEKYDMHLPMFWICGVPQYNMPNRKFLPEDCRYILGPEHKEPY